MKKASKSQTHHGITLTDEFAWLRADNWQEVLQDPNKLPVDIRAHLEAENKASEAYLAPTKALREELYTELKSRLKDDDAGVPFQNGEFDYSWYFEKGADYRTWYRRSADGSEEILLNETELAEGEKYFQLGAYEISPNHKFLAYTADTQGSEFYTLYIKDLTTGETKEIAQKLSSEVVWANDNDTLFILRLTDNHQPDEVARISYNTGEETKVFIEKDKTLFVHVSKTEDGEYICISSHDHSFSEVSVIPAAAPSSFPQLIMSRKPDVQYSVSHWEGQFYVLTNQQAEDFQIITASAQGVFAGTPDWKILVGHTPGHLIESMILQNGYLIMETRHNALPQIKMLNLASMTLERLEFDSPAYSISVIPQKQSNHNYLRMSYSTPIQPPQIWEAELGGKNRILLKETEIPCGFNSADYKVKRDYVTAEDGAKIPLTRWYHKDTNPNTAPVLQYGYGAYGISMDAAYRHSAFSLVDRGFVYAVAHIRGGKDCGYSWYKSGKMENKKNTFTDFLAVTDFLQQETGNQSSRYICAHGGSAGGMLMGAVANAVEPDKITSIVAQVPFVDVLNTILDDTLPLTPPEWREWGNPIEEKGAFDYIQSYSPYDNLVKKDYPAIYALGGLTDPRVTYWEPAKWIAKLRDYKTNPSTPLLLDIDMTSGHGGASGRYEYLKEIAKIQAFVLTQATEYKRKNGE